MKENQLSKRLCKSINTVKLVLFIGLISCANLVNATCSGKFMNPITDICWGCMFPFYIAGATLVNPNGEQPAGAYLPPPVCVVPWLGLTKVGIGLSMYEPNKMIDVTNDPFCMVGLNGTDIGKGLENVFARGTSQEIDSMSKDSRFYQVHEYADPILAILGMDLGVGCTSIGGMDALYMSEIDPLWNNDSLTFWMNPDVILYANPLQAITCGIDCVTNTVGAWNVASHGGTYWCAGCQGSMFPLDGNSTGVTPMNGAIGAMERMMFKLNREGLEYSTAGPQALYLPIVPSPIMDKTQYKYSMIFPLTFIDPLSGGKCCAPFGRTTEGWTAGHSFPVAGENFLFHLYQRRDCCFGTLVP